MKRLEIIPVLLYLASLIYKLTGLPQGNLVFSVASAILAMTYIIFAWFLFPVKGIRNQNGLISVISGLIYGYGIIGIIVFLYGYNLLLQILIILLILLGIAQFIMMRKNIVDDLKPYFSRLFFRSLVWLTFSLIVYYMGTYLV